MQIYSVVSEEKMFEETVKDNDRQTPIDSNNSRPTVRLAKIKWIW